MKLNVSCALLFWNLTMAISLFGAAGDPDISFAGTGTRRIGFGGGEDQAFASTVQPDGKLIMAGSSGLYPYNGSFSLVRLDTNNVPDSTFGDGGKVITPVSKDGLDFSDARVNAVKVQADGKIVVAGYAYTGTNRFDFTMVRYHTNGAIDTSFGTNGTGIVFTDFGTGSVIRAMSIQADGKIVVGGYTTYPANAQEGAVALARYQTNGVLDPSFGVGGVRVTTGVTGYTGVHSLLVQADGKILTAGIGIGPGHNGIDFALYRYTTNGSPDSTFGGGTGRVFTQISTNNNNYFDSVAAVAIQPGTEAVGTPDKIIVVGTYNNYNDNGHTIIALTRYTMDGGLDSTFGNNGIVTNRITTADNAAGVAIQTILVNTRRIVVGGYSTLNGTNYFTLVRYLASGAFDTAFGGNGTGWNLVPISLGNSSYSPATALTVQAGKFVLAGFSEVSPRNNDFTAVRFNNDGTRDTSFGSGGILTVDLMDRTSTAKGVAIQGDGKMVVAGYAAHGEFNGVAVARFNMDGSLDSTFGVNGRVKTVAPTGSLSANAVLIQPDGKIVVAGSALVGSVEDFAILRYLANGALDPSFGSNGITKTSLAAGRDVANAIAMQPDGKLIAAGTSTTANNSDFAVVRYTTNGLPDNTFDGDGKVITAVAAANDVAAAVKVQADGKIVVGGSAEINGNSDFAMVRYNTNGALDNAFGSFGRVGTDIGTGTSDAVFSMVIQPNGRILLAGYSASGVSADVALVRYLTNGLPDNSFDLDGKVTTPIGLSADYGTSVALLPDGRIVLAGIAIIGAHAEFAAVRYYTNGTVDDSFGLGGRTVVDFNDGGENYAWSLALDSMGRAVIAGEAGSLFAVARLQGNPLLKILSINHLSGGTNRLTGVGVPGDNHTLIASPTVTGSFTPLAPVTSDSQGNWQYDDPPAPGVNTRFYQLAYP